MPPAGTPRLHIPHAELTDGKKHTIYVASTVREGAVVKVSSNNTVGSVDLKFLDINGFEEKNHDLIGGQYLSFVKTGETKTVSGLSFHEYVIEKGTNFASAGGGGGLATVASDDTLKGCLLYTSPSPRDRQKSRMPSSA